MGREPEYSIIAGRCNMRSSTAARVDLDTPDFQDRLGAAIAACDLDAINACVAEGADLNAPVDSIEPRCTMLSCVPPEALSFPCCLSWTLKLTDTIRWEPMRSHTPPPKVCVLTTRLLVAAWDDVNAPDRYGDSPLLVAVQNDSTDALRELMAAGGRVHDASGGWYEISFLSMPGTNADIVRLLVGLEVIAVEDVFDNSSQKGDDLLEGRMEADVDVRAPVVIAGVSKLPLRRV